MLIVTLDIETVTPRQARSDRFPPLPDHEPIVICWLVADSVSGQLRFEHRVARGDDDAWERKALEAFARQASVADRLVTYNGRGFDMPLLGLRALRESVDWSWWPPRRHRFPQVGRQLFHFDLLDQLGDYGAARFGLDRVARLIGLPGKLDTRGDQVSDLWRAGERQRVVDYCCQDVFQTWMIYLRLIASVEPESPTTHQWDQSVEWARETAELRALFCPPATPPAEPPATPSSPSPPPRRRPRFARYRARSSN